MGHVLSAGEVHIWTAHLAAVNRGANLESSLDADERERACRFHFPEHRLQYEFAHAVLRDVLSRYLGCSPGEITFTKNAFGKPALAEETGARRLEFNMTHAGGAVLIALSSNRQLGIDIEEVRPISYLREVAQSHFTPAECGYVLSRVSLERDSAFFRCWTRKEAYVKALGRGLSAPLVSFDTAIPAGQPGRELPGGAEVRGIGSWWLGDLEVSHPYLGAIVVESPVDHLIYFEWQADTTLTYTPPVRIVTVHNAS